MGNNVFNAVPTSTCVLQVPKGTKNSYLRADQWNAFINIIEETGDEYIGDINDDSSVDGNDLNILVNIIIGKDEADKYDGLANIDGEGGIDGGDLNALINILLGQ